MSEDPDFFIFLSTIEHLDLVIRNTKIEGTKN